MKTIKTKALITERIAFFNRMLKANISEKQIQEFKTAKKYWTKLQKILKYKIVYSDLRLKQICDDTIKPLLKFNIKQRQDIIDFMEKQKEIQEQSYEESVKMTEGQFIDFNNEQQKWIDKFTVTINEILECEKELKSLKV